MDFHIPGSTYSQVRPFSKWVVPYGTLLGKLTALSFRHRLSSARPTHRTSRT